MADTPEVQLLGLKQALRAYVEAIETQSARHIKPLHWYIAARLAIEGGFHPNEITPRPPIRVESVGRGRDRRYRLHYDPSAGRPGEHTILGGVKTKQVDVTVTKAGIGPCIAVSVKGTVKSFRNLTNRMEEAIGDCTNLHISYPNLVYGFLHVMKANVAGPGIQPNDVAITARGEVTTSIRRYHDAMVELTGRRGVRNDFTRYEAVALALVQPTGDAIGEVLPSFPLSNSRLLFEAFFESLYASYDHRFVFAAPDLKKVTRRVEWDEQSPLFTLAPELGITPRVAGDISAEGEQA
jgi:hypothetical protein